MQLKDFLQQTALRVEAALNASLGVASLEGATLEDTTLESATRGAEKLASAMHYAALGPGKRLRPALVYACARTLRGAEYDAAACDAAAAALECIHAYSLVHDDLPAMDDDELRRGRPTCHIRYDEATAILAGDALQTRAFELLLASSADAQLKLRLLDELAQASGARGMVAGQAIDLDSVDKALNLGQLETMHRLKTGALIRASARMGALLGDAGEVQLAAITHYAEAVGLAFQVQDDILDVTADTAILGKTQGADAARNKPTYVSLLGLEGAREKLDGLHRQAIDALAQLGGDTALLRELADYIVQRSH